ncbi:benzoate/H(+) symporter BenE family transporter [[Kitasatospora] papulosa]|uniref:benzoate/H(+) symporter BenE family transporter n=1 Tax=[Kitasatospora] papulosa TaxID=1464011 RepID=UPI0036C0AB83
MTAGPAVPTTEVHTGRSPSGGPRPRLLRDLSLSAVLAGVVAVVSLLATASGVTLFGIGSAFWGLVFGVAAHLVLNGRFRSVGPRRRPDAGSA